MKTAIPFMPLASKTRTPIVRVPADETQRLAALRRYNILDTPPEGEFDNAALFAARLCGTRLAYISFIDSDRQWFKATVGFKVTEGPRIFAIGAHAILQKEPFVVRDLSQDPRFADNPAVMSQPPLCFYAACPLITPDGYAIGVLAVMDDQPLDLSTDQLNALAGVARQVMDRLEARIHPRAPSPQIAAETEHRIARIFDDVPFGLLLVDLAFNSIRMNRAFCDMLGYSEQELASMSYTQTTHPDDLNNDAELGVKLFHGEIPSYTVQKRYITRAGATIWVELNARLIRDQDDKPKYALITYQDITDRKKTEAALLEREAELARSNNELQRFAYIASHDLQEPLRTVSLYTDLIARRYKQHLDPDADEFIGYVVSATLRMKRLIHDLLEYSRVSAAGREPQPTDCTVVLERSLANLHAAIESASANVTHDSLPTVCSDPLQLEQVFQNLIGNAIKFRSQSPPQIHVSAERQDGMWRLSVSDNGIGIDPRYQERIFEVFQRLHPNASFEGTGIGLAVCKRIIEQHGGRIWVQSQPGHGSTFYFTCKSV